MKLLILGFLALLLLQNDALASSSFSSSYNMSEEQQPTPDNNEADTSDSSRYNLRHLMSEKKKAKLLQQQQANKKVLMKQLMKQQNNNNDEQSEKQKKKEKKKKNEQTGEEEDEMEEESSASEEVVQKTTQRPTPSPTKPLQTNTFPCFTISTYLSLDTDIQSLSNSISRSSDRSHFFGGILRLAAHDFMDYDRSSSSSPGGSDGCIDMNHPSNVGLDTIWCSNCPLQQLYERKYSHLISIADYWIAAATIVIRQTSQDNAGGSLDMMGSYKWGRKDSKRCVGSGERLPLSSGCDEVERVFIRNMGLSWSESVALMGAHSLGGGGRDRSGHEGTWVDDSEAQVFDNKYYQSLVSEPWEPRNMNGNKQDWTTGRGGSRLMLNTDLCLAYDIDDNINEGIPCCATSSPNADDCIDREASERKCPLGYSNNDSRSDASDAVQEMLGGPNNDPFYEAFEKAWKKATTKGYSKNDLFPLSDTC